MSMIEYHPEGRKSRLRAIVAELELTMNDTIPAPLRDAWRRLVVAMDLGPEPAVRACPHCGKLGMAAATLCGFCWKQTPPVITVVAKPT